MVILAGVSNSQKQLESSRTFPLPVHLFIRKLLGEGNQQPTILQTTRQASHFLHTGSKLASNIGWYSRGLSGGGRKYPWKENRVCTSVSMTNKPNVAVIQKASENAERFNSLSSLVAEEIKTWITGVGGIIDNVSLTIGCWALLFHTIPINCGYFCRIKKTNNVGNPEWSKHQKQVRPRLTGVFFPLRTESAFKFRRDCHWNNHWWKNWNHAGSW